MLTTRQGLGTPGEPLFGARGWGMPGQAPQRKGTCACACACARPGRIGDVDGDTCQEGQGSKPACRPSSLSPRSSLVTHSPGPSHAGTPRGQSRAEGTCPHGLPSPHIPFQTHPVPTCSLPHAERLCRRRARPPSTQVGAAPAAGLWARWVPPLIPPVQPGPQFPATTVSPDLPCPGFLDP